MKLDIGVILERVKYVLHADSDAGAARKMGLPTTAISNWRKRNTIPVQDLLDLAQSNGLNMHWLLTGEGPERMTEERNVIPRKITDEYPYILGFIMACQLGDINLMKATAFRMLESLDGEISIPFLQK